MLQTQRNWHAACNTRATSHRHAFSAILPFPRDIFSFRFSKSRLPVMFRFCFMNLIFNFSYSCFKTSVFAELSKM